MMREALLSRAPIPAANIHPMPTEASQPGRQRQRAMSSELKSFYGAERLDPARPLFDVTFWAWDRTAIRRRCFPARACSGSAIAGSPPSSAPRPKRASR